jgi:hypothetical protein
MLEIEPYFAHMCLYGNLERIQYIYEMHPNMKFAFRVYNSSDDDDDDVDQQRKTNYCNVAMINSCKYEHIEIAKWLLDKYPKLINSYDSYIFREIACGTGNLELCQWLHTQFPKCGGYEMAYRVALSNNHIHICKWIMEVDPDLLTSGYIFENTCGRGNLEMCQWLKETIEITQLMYNDAFIKACINGHIHICKWLLTVNPDLAPQTWIHEDEDDSDEDMFMDYLSTYKERKQLTRGERRQHDLIQDVCQYNQLTMCQWLYDLEPKLFNNVTEIFRYARTNLHLDMCKWIYSLNKGVEITKKSFSFLSSYNNDKDYLPMCQWLEKTDPVCLTIKNCKYIFNNVCKKGHFNVCKWLYDLYPDICKDLITDELFAEVCGNRQLDVCQWLYEMNPKLNVKFYDGKNIMIYHHYYSLEMLQWIHNLDPEFDIYVNDYVLFKSALEYQNLELGKWLSKLSNKKYEIIMDNIKEYHFSPNIDITVKKD